MKNSKIYGAHIVDLALYADDYLIISDLHLGYEEALNYQGVMVPKFQYPLIIQRMEDILDVCSAEKIIINGDLKHEFGKINRQEWNETINFIDFLKERFQEIILIQGNHDPLTPIIARKTGLKVCKHYSTGKYVVFHGDQLPARNLVEETMIIGHEHPAVGIRSGERVEKMKCYLQGKYDDKNLIVMPSFNFISEGSDILHDKSLSPLLKKENMNTWDVIGVENFEILNFGSLEDLVCFQQKYNLKV